MGRLRLQLLANSVVSGAEMPPKKHLTWFQGRDRKGTKHFVHSCLLVKVIGLSVQCWLNVSHILELILVE